MIPSTVATCLRVVWAIGGTRDRYLKHEAAQDQYLGRILCGLPVDRSEFCTVPPHCGESIKEKVVQDFENQCFHT